MTRKFTIFMLLLAVISVISGCNSKDKEDEEVLAVDYSNTAVTAFKLARNDKVLPALDSVFFSIDLPNARIYNADSLPKGTKIDKLVVNIGLPTVNSATLIEPAHDGIPAREIAYTSKTKDTIDFSHGPVALRVISQDKKLTRTYEIKINVHQQQADSLYWNQLAVRTLPGGIADPDAQRSVQMGDVVYCMVSKGSDIRLSYTSDPAADAWTTITPRLPQGASVATLSSAGGSLYILDEGENLYSSTDGEQWTACGVKMHWLYGEYNGSLLGSSSDAGSWKIVSYPVAAEMDAPDGFPIEGTSTMLQFESKWAQLPTAVMVGGRTADGSLTSATWGFDGKTWAVISMTSLPQGMEGVALVPYFTYHTSTTTWAITLHSTLFAIGGRTADGVAQRSVYLSMDNGVNWRLADQYLQLPDYIPAMADAQGFVYESVIHARSASSAWRACEPTPLPAWWCIAAVPQSRAVGPIDEWDCPYIYLFGGVGVDGQLANTIWRGVINRLTFRPLQ